MNDHIKFLKNLDLSAISCDKSTDIWSGDEISGADDLSFYPVFRFNNLYSYHPYFLINHKKTLILNERFCKAPKHNPYYSGLETIDEQITRVGGPQIYKPSFFNKNEYVRAFSDAMCADINEIESCYPDHEHAVLCGGKDSLNLLLLPWKCRVTALSSYPNYPLVKQFILNNNLDIQLLQLHDKNNSTIKKEILFNLNHVDIRHFRWTGDLNKIAEEKNRKVIFWKGQVADAFLTPKWKKIFHNDGNFFRYAMTRVANKFGIYKDDYLIYRAHQAFWDRCAMWQGYHMSFLRAICGTLVLSGYHGRRCRDLIRQACLPSVINEDVRPLIGEMIAGKKVWYPETNPGPPFTGTRSANNTDVNNIISLLPADIKVVKK